MDGSTGEGGGQILRTTLALSTILKKEVRIVKIRAGRSRPGLMAQHLTSVIATGALCDAHMSGATVGSVELEYKPGQIRSGRFRFDVGTAGSVALVLQALMPIAAFAPGRVELEITGGTDVKWSPPIDYLSMVTLPILQRFGCHARLDLIRRGHFPRGGGLVRFISEPSRGFRALKLLDPGAVVKTRLVSHVVGLPRHVAERTADSAKMIVQESSLPAPETRLDVTPNGPYIGSGSGIVLVAESERDALLGGDALGEKAVPAEKVGAEAANKLIEDLASNSFLDRHMADIVVPYAALASGTSEVSIARITRHVQTNVQISELLTGVRFQLKGEVDKPGRFSVNGLGLEQSLSLA
ncbi:MAG TPA: RNA 3'-terminal phosphate cyclase [Candidatus Binatus sp.]|nr:RNA 3'-terminal phosphate cyclase [Candidatus Binatus sp.]